MINIAVIYHNKDNDGLMSLFLINKVLEKIKHRYPKFKEDFLVDYIGYSYQEEADWMINPNNMVLKYSQYIFVDITPPIAWLEKNKNLMILNGKNLLFDVIREHTSLMDIWPDSLITIFDHHNDKLDSIKEFAAENLHENTIKIYNNPIEKISACKIIYEHFSRISIVDFYGYFFLTVEFSTYDMWLFTNYDRHSKERVLCLDLYFRQFIDDIPRYFAEVENFTLKYGYFEPFIEGKKLLIEKEEEALKLIENGKFYSSKQIFVFEGYPTYFVEEKIKELSNDNIKIWVGYEVKENQIKFNVRSTNNKANKLCKVFKGGGHPNAGGFAINIETVEKNALDELMIYNTPENVWMIANEFLSK